MGQFKQFMYEVKTLRHIRVYSYLAKVSLLFEALQQLRVVLLLEEMCMKRPGTLWKGLRACSAERLVGLSTPRRQVV